MLPIDLSGKRALVAGIADDKGYGWAIVRSLAQAGASVCVGTWPPTMRIFTKSLERGKLDMSLPGGGELELERIYPLDAVFDTPDDVPEEVKEDKRYVDLEGYTIQGVANALRRDFGEDCLDIVVHSLANGPEVQNALIDTSRAGYLAALSASAYSLVSMVQRFGPLMRPGGAVASLSYLAAERVIPGYGGGMSSAKAALEGDTRTLAFEAGRRYGVRVNTISAGPLASRAAKAIGTIQRMVEYYEENAALPEANTAEEVGMAATFLCSPLASGITGETLHVDKGYHAMGMKAEATLSEN
ncbi:MAG TPA: enoyl-[acyl-carrier-protein] reductase [Gemmatimonadetes bacterium]|nr:enoyl-[acyl-carrier-protein] reductase [Gemmatimonadota bacterium]HBV05704.1 enoyl-[acyl-carrier-protein] reductase [Gemmatimonadota bacterium]HCO13019.1 enoyl-[acyl-carrier-protein] reductase [Gemmatimonadota bacterium]